MAGMTEKSKDRNEKCKNSHSAHSKHPLQKKKGEDNWGFVNNTNQRIMISSRNNI